MYFGKNLLNYSLQLVLNCDNFDLERRVRAVMKPNILLITTDTQRWDTLRCMGSEFAQSPHLDRLAAEGVLFEQGHTSSPVCSPARCSLMTGLHTPIHGCIENGIRRRANLPMFTDVLKQEGYYNIMVGKTHFDPVPESFDVVKKATEKSNDADDIYAQHIRSYGYERVSRDPNPIPEHLFVDAFLADLAIAEMDKAIYQNKGPFFAFCSLISPHEPLDPPGIWRELYDDIDLPTVNYTEGEINRFPKQLKNLLGLTTDESADGMKDHTAIEKARKLYYGLAAYCDAQVGKLLDYLDRSGLRNNTLVIFTSDHGIQLFDHGFNDKHNYYDESWKVPFILSMPGTLPSGQKREFAIWNDIPATILGAAGTEAPYIQGFDLFTPLKNGLPSPRKCAVASLYKSAALATKRWKLEYYFEDRRARLFDRIKDPKEMSDLYDHPKYRHIRNEMVQALLHWRSDLSDVNALISSTGGGGPVARRIASHTLNMKGTDSESRLNDWAEQIDALECQI